MNRRQKLVNTLRFAMLAGSFLILNVNAESSQVPPPMEDPVVTEWTPGEIRKLDKASGKLTIRHGDIKKFNMQAMTMVFTVKNQSMLEGFKVGDKIQFIVVQEQGKFIVTDMQAQPMQQ